MARSAKEILREGKYNVGNGRGGSYLRSFSADDIQQIAETADQMLAEGLRIPAPWYHDKEDKPVKVEELTQSSKDNAGYWDRVYTSLNEDGTLSLYGELEAPGTLEDKESPAYKVGRSSRDVSPWIEPEFTDGDGKVWKNALMHVALPKYPVAKKQTNFIPLPDNQPSEVIAMSNYIKPNQDTTDVPTLLTLLEKCGISLPSDTDASNIMERLMVACQQLSKNKSDNGVTDKPNNSYVRTAPIMMSLSVDQQKAIVDAGVTNPATSQPFVLSDFVDQTSAIEKERDQHKAASALMSTVLNTMHRDKYAARIDALVQEGKVDKEYADANLLPMLETVVMSLDTEGRPEKTNLDTVLIPLEALPGKKGASQATPTTSDSLLMSHQIPASGITEPHPDSANQMSSEDEVSLVNRMLGNA